MQEGQDVLAGAIQGMTSPNGNVIENARARCLFNTVAVRFVQFKLRAHFLDLKFLGHDG